MLDIKLRFRSFKISGVMSKGHLEEACPSLYAHRGGLHLSFRPTVWASLFLCFHFSDTSAGYDLWFLIGFFLIHLYLDWQLSDMSHSQGCFLFIQTSVFNPCVFDLSYGMTNLKGLIPSMWPEKDSFVFAFDGVEWTKRLIYFWDLS